MFPDLRMKLRLGRRFAQFATGRIRRGGHDSAIYEMSCSAFAVSDENTRGN